ncbi:MAG: putative 2OG-Fe(II) oxygenase, partial [Pseudomonadota bacterium]
AHPGCSWCGIYYLQVGDSEPVEVGAPNGLNRFYCPISTGGMVSDYGAAYLNAGYVDPPVRDGMLILFPAHLQHSGLPYAGSRDRLIISFNSRSYLGPKPS